MWMEIWSSVAITKLLPGIWTMQKINLMSVSPEIHNQQTKSYKAWIFTTFIFTLKFVFTFTCKIQQYGALQVSKGAQRHCSHLRHIDVFSVHQLHVQQPSTHAKPEAASTVLGSWWWAVFRPKHIELHINMKQNCDTLWRLVGFYIWIILWCTDPQASNWVQNFVQTNAKRKLRNVLCNSSHRASYVCYHIHYVGKLKKLLTVVPCNLKL